MGGPNFLGFMFLLLPHIDVEMLTAASNDGRITAASASALRGFASHNHSPFRQCSEMLTAGNDDRRIACGAKVQSRAMHAPSPFLESGLEV